MKFFRNKPLLITAAAVVLLLVLALATSGERTVTWVESAVGSVAQPVQTFAANVSGAIIGFFENLFHTTDADQENQQLKVRVAQLEQNLTKMNQLEQENERLKGLLNYVEQEQDWEYVTASVIGKGQGIWFDIFTISAGRNAGIQKDQAVVCADGLVGRVISVGATWAKVSALVDAGFSASVMVERTRDNGMISGMLEAGNNINTLKLYYLPSGSDLVPGDTIVTNGLGGVFPKGIVAGTVTEVTRQSDTTNSNALVEPAVDFTRLEEVMVIVSRQPEGE
ncbi:MAG: rod shape-determining protein MreC [Bacillota bacterium]